MFSGIFSPISLLSEASLSLISLVPSLSSLSWLASFAGVQGLPGPSCLTAVWTLTWADSWSICDIFQLWILRFLLKFALN